MNIEQVQALLYLVESDRPINKVLMELIDLLVRIRELISDITAIDEVIEVSKICS